MTYIRRERAADHIAIRQVEEQAFDRPNEADLVDALRAQGQLVLSLVAVEDEQIVGHIAFSPIKIEREDATFDAVALGPTAVLPQHQRRRIGSQLVARGLDLLRDDGHGVVVVLGHPTFYPRFGFQPAATYGIHSPYNVPDDVFMVVELLPGALHGMSGTVRYPPAFDLV